jgi:hypothetical protein
MATDKQYRLEEALAFARRAMEIGQRLDVELMEILGAVEYVAHLFDCGRLAEGIALDDRWKRADALDDPLRYLRRPESVPSCTSQCSTRFEATRS